VAPAEADWLDTPLQDWNRPGSAVPAAPPPVGDGPDVPRCARLVRVPQSPADQAVRAAGWFLFGEPDQPLPGMTIVKADSAVDGMCRPWGYQFFVFVDGTFAGTLSPVPMNARTDGSLVRVEAAGNDQLTAHYSRYAPADPLCCPSRTSTVTYRVDRAARSVGPVSVRTERAP
jgi:hypothetical protein